MGASTIVAGVIVAWFASLADRFFASDHGLLRLRLALRAVLSVMLTVGVLALVKVTPVALMLGAVCAMICSTSLRNGTTEERARHLVLYLPVLALSITAGTLLAPRAIVADVVFVAIMFAGVYARRFDQVGAGLGTAGFMAYFYALFVHTPPANLAAMWLAGAVGLGATGLMALVVLRDTPMSTLRRTTLSIRAQVARLIEELAKLLDHDEQLTDGEELPHAVARQAVRLHETTLQIEDSADLLGLDPQWQRQLVDAELSADRLARSTIRAIASDLDTGARTELAADLRGLHRFVDRDPEAALTLDVDQLVSLIGRYDIRGDPGGLPTDPVHHVMLVHRAIRELLLAVVQIRRTTSRVLADGIAATPRATTSSREPTLEDVEQELLPDSLAPEPADGAAVVPMHRELASYLRTAIQAAIGGSLAIVGGTWLSGARWYWAAIAGFLVFGGTTSRGDLLVKGWRRVWGTLLGIIAGTLLATVVSGHPVINLALLLGCIFLAFYLLRVSYAAMTFFMTIMLGMLYDILGEFSPNLLLLRLEETAIGVAGSMVAAMLVLPTRTRATVLTELHDYFTALHIELSDAQRLLVEADQVSVIAATREVDRAATDVRTALAPMVYRLSPSRVRRGHATRLLALTEESALAARNLARAAEPGALLHLPEAVDTLRRLIDNTDLLRDATDGTPNTARKLVSGPALASSIDARALVAAHSGDQPDRVEVLHLRRTINCLDRLDKLLLGMAAPLSQTISIPLDTRN